MRLLLVARNQQALEQAREQLQREGIQPDIWAADVSKQSHMTGLVAEAERVLKHVDVLVNNAGSATSAPFLETDLDLWNETIEANLTSTYLCTKAFLPGMIERKNGRIINISSVAGKIGFRYTTAYCAAKHAVLGLTKALALEVARTGVTVNAVCPGWVDTPMTDNTIRNITEKTGWIPEKARRFLEEQSPLHRLISPEEVSAAVRFLVSPEASAINGQGVNVCGGQVFT